MRVRLKELSPSMRRTCPYHFSQLGIVSFRRPKSSSLKKYMQKVQNDPFTNKKKSEFFRSRAAYKLIEIDQRCRLFNKSSKNIVDLGFAPGAWTQVAVHALEKRKIDNYRILGIDINDAVPYKGCSYIQGDLLKKETHLKIKQFFKGEEIDLIMSDMMVNCIGHSHYDHLGNMELCSAAMILAFDQLKTRGNLVMKVWHGAEEELLELRMRIMFERLVRMKPESSRAESSELFYIGLKKRDLNISLQELFSDKETLLKYSI